MFSNFTIGLLFGIGAGGWVFARLHRSSGGNTRSAAIGASVVGLLSLVAITILLGVIFK